MIETLVKSRSRKFRSRFPSTATTATGSPPLRAQRHRFAFAKHAVFPLMFGYELGALNLGILLSALFCTWAYYRHEVLWKVLIRYFFVLCILPIIGIAVAFALI
jgi:hypothetical protein